MIIIILITIIVIITTTTMIINNISSALKFTRIDLISVDFQFSQPEAGDVFG